MRKIILLSFICLTNIQLLLAQSFQEICETATTNGTIVDCVYYGDTLYCTGFFSTICNEPVNYVAKWDNNEWKSSAVSISDPGHALEVIEDQLYVAKYVESIDSNWVYVYDGQALNKVGQGVYLTTASGFSQLPIIYDIIEYNGKIIACGEFDKVGQEAITGIMQWNGTNWEALGAGLEGNIINTAPVLYPHQMMVYNSELYIVGNFRYAGGEEVNGVAKWNGTEWSKMGDGFNSTIYGITVFNDEIIVGGDFTESNGVSINRIAKWDGSQWIALDFGFTTSSPNDYIFVHTLKVIDDELYIGGGLKELTYTDNSTEICGGIVAYSGSSINTFNGGVPGNDIEAIIKTNDQQLLIGGGVFGNGYSGIMDMETSIGQIKLDRDVHIFPNPFNQSIGISTEITFKEYIVFDNLGNVVNMGKYMENLSLDLMPGVYILKLKNEYFYTTHKIIKI